MSDHNEYDVLDSLLDSINNDDTMEKKINDFARTKQRKKRIERARETSADFQSQYSSEARQKAREERMNSVLSPVWKGQPSASFPKDPQPDGGDTMVVSNGISQSQHAAGSVPEKNSVPDSNDGTIMFQKTEPAQPEHSDVDHTLPVNLEDEGDDSTVYMNEDEIQNLLENDEPILKREYIRSDQGGYNPVRKNAPSNRPVPGPERTYPSYERPVSQKKMSWKWPAAVFGLVLGAFLIYGGLQLFNNYIAAADSEKSEERQKLFDQVKAWAENYDSYDDEEKRKITEYEKMFNKLSDDQKREINEILMNAAGKNFDELLALAKSDAKQDTNSNMTQIAEEKGRLRQQIQDLSSELQSKQNDLNSLNNDVNNASDTLARAQSDYDGAIGNYNSAVNEQNSNSAQLNKLAADLTADTASLEQAKKDLTDLQNSSEEAEDKEQKMKDLQDTISSLQTSISQNQKDQTELKSSIDTANGNIGYLKGIADSAQGALESAQSAYNQAASNPEIGRLQSEIADLQNQISSLQAKLDSLN